MIDFLNLRQINERHGEEIREAIDRVLRSGWYILANETESFEQEFGDYCGAKHCIGVANGLDALSLALRAMEVGPGDEVIVPSNTFIATWLAVSHVGAKPVPVEPDPATFNLDPSRVESAITDRTRVIIPVHLYGQPADLSPVLEIAQRRGLRVLEDAAQAHGARYRGKRIGTHGDAVTWSFYPGKNLGAVGDGGAITTDNPELALRLRALRNYGSNTKYHHEIAGFNSRLDEMQAAVLRVKLRNLDADNKHRASIARAYIEGMRGSGVKLPAVPSWAEPVWHLFVVRHPQRDLLATRLRESGVATMVHYPVAPHLQPAYLHLGLARGVLPIAESMQSEVLSLPIGPTQTAIETEAVVLAVLRAVSSL